MKASAFRRWPVAGAYSLEQTTRLTGGSDCLKRSDYGAVQTDLQDSIYPT